MNVAALSRETPAIRRPTTTATRYVNIAAASPVAAPALTGLATLTHYVPIVGPVYSYVNDATWGPPTANQPENDYTFGQATHFTFGPGESVSAEGFGFLPSQSGAVDYYCTVRVEGELVAQ